MTRFTRLALLPLALFAVACDTPDATPNDDAIEVADDNDAAAAEGRGRGHGGKLAKLDTDKDGALSLEEVKAHPRLAEKFTELDTDKDGKLNKDELHAMKGKHGKHGKHGGQDWHAKSPAERAAHKLAKYDTNGDKVLTPDELAGGRFADKFAEIDGDKNGKLTLEELTTWKTAHAGDKHGGWKGKEMHGERGDHGGKGWSRDPEERADKIFAKLDANKDAVLTRDEVTGGRFADKFAEADTNNDGKLTRDELIAFRPAKPAREDAPAVR